MKSFNCLLLSFFLCLTLVTNASAAWVINYANIRKQVLYEGGSSINHFYMDILDETSGSYVEEDIIDSFTLLDPDGNIVADSKPNFGQFSNSLNARFDASTGQWTYDENFSSYSHFSMNISVPLKTGTYKIEVLTTDGQTLEGEAVFNDHSTLPAIKSSSFTIKKDDSGNIIWKWDIPDSLSIMSLTEQIQLRPFIEIYDELGQITGELYSKGYSPSNNVWIIPNNVIEKLTALGPIFKFTIQLRTVDNNNRSYSNGVSININDIKGYSNFMMGLKMNFHGIPKVGDTVTFTTISNHVEGSNIYYRFDLVPNYGTNEYAPDDIFINMQDFSLLNTCSYKFTEAGSYIVVVYASDSASFPAIPAKPIYGGAITISE